MDYSTLEQDWIRFFALRQRIFDAIKKVDEGYHKSYEGAMDVEFSFQNIYEAEDVTDTVLVRISLHCYLLVNGRHIEWTGHTFKEALDKASEDIEDILQSCE